MPTSSWVARLDILPVEIVVRGYLAGSTATSVLTMYNKGKREMYGVRFPDGLRDNEALAQPIITPTSKAFDGAHDEPLSPDEIVDQRLLTKFQWEQVSRYALALFARGQAMARDRGLILADTKYEFGTDPEGRIMLADEIHTPDSSRYWFAASYPRRFASGKSPRASTRTSCATGSPNAAILTRSPSPTFPPSSSRRRRGCTSGLSRPSRAGHSSHRPTATRCDGYARTWLATSTGGQAPAAYQVKFN